LDWLHALRELTSEHCSKLVATGIAYGPYLEHLKTHPGERRRNPNIALLFETKLESIYDAAADIGDEIIVPFFERFGYFPYFLPLTRESLHHPYPEIGETLRKAFKASSIQFFP